MLQKLKQIPALIKRYELHDTRNIGLIIFAVLAITLTWSGIQAIQLNYQLQKRVAKIEAENQVLELENATAKLRNQYYTTSQFQELEARRLLGKAAPGERVYIVNKDVALSKVKASLPTEAEKQVVTEASTNKWQRNLQDWLDFFFNRPFDS